MALAHLSPPVTDRPYALVEADSGETLASLDREGIKDLYQRNGAILLRGFAGGLEDFRAFARRFCKVAVHNDSRNRARLGADGDIQSVNLGTKAFPLHPELSREPWKPDACFFYCMVPPTAGGATTICDGVQIVRELPAVLRAEMAARRLKYAMPATPAILEYWVGTNAPDETLLAHPPADCPYRFERIDGRMARVFTRPLLHRPMFTDELAFGNFLLFARDLLGNRAYPTFDDGTPVPDEWMDAVRKVGERLTVPIEWQAGDLLMLDNSRFMHGRTAITDPDKRLIATYFGYLDFARPDEEEPSDAVWRKPGFEPPPTKLSAAG